MIRNDRGDHFLLVTQHDHAILAARLAEHLGTARFHGPDPRPQTLRGIALHDAGWPVHDDAPTLNDGRLPLHVMETPAGVATTVWRESSRRAADAGPYAGLLVSLHVFNLSARWVKPELTPAEKFERRDELFLINQFQQDEIERQERYRAELGMATDRPLHLGLADLGVDPAEDRLRFNFAWLRAMDAISLEACTGKRVFDRPPIVHPSVGEPTVDLRLGHPTHGVTTVDPWPFSTSKIELSVPARRLPTTPFESEQAFRDAYAAAKPFEWALTFRP